MKNLFLILNIKKLNTKGMTLIEVVASMAMLALISLAIYNGTALILRGYDMGQFVYESNGKIEQRIETGTVPGSSGTVSFKVNTKDVVVNGNFYTSSETRGDMQVTLSRFEP